MKRIRIGNDIKIIIPLAFKGEAQTILDVAEFHIFVKQSYGKVVSSAGDRSALVELPYTIDRENQKINALWSADQQRYLGEYDIIIKASTLSGAKACADKSYAVELVSRCELEDVDITEGTVQAVIDMDVLTLTFGGLSAYEIAVVHGFTGTEEEWLESLRPQDGEITTDKIADGAITEPKLAPELKEWIIGGAGIPDAPKTGDQYARKDGAWEKVDGLTEEQKQLLIDLENEVFKLSATYTSNNAGTFETGTSITPTASFKIERHGRDVASEAVVTPGIDITIASNNKSWTKKTAISEGNWAQRTTITQGGQTVDLGVLTWAFYNFRYRGEVDSIPTDYPSAIKALKTQELSEQTTLGSTALSANKYYLFAVCIPDERSPRFIVRHAQTGGEISGIVTGVCQVARKNGTGTEYYAYVLVPKSSSSWNFTISNS